MSMRKIFTFGLMAFFISSSLAGQYRALALETWTPAKTHRDSSGITLQPGTAKTEAREPDWKRTTPDPTIDIRFKRPAISTTTRETDNYGEERRPATQRPALSDSRRVDSAKKNTAALAAAIEEGDELMQPALPLADYVAPRKPVRKTASSLKPHTDRRAVGMREAGEFRSRSADERLQPIDSFADEAAMNSLITAGSEDITFTDAQLRLVSQLLTDSQVKLAAEEEPLPEAPRDEIGDRVVPTDLGDVEPFYDDACCPPRPRLFWTAGMEATFLKPDLNSDGVSWTVEDIDVDRHDVFSSASNDVDSLYMSPRVWIGVQGCAWGANLRYWHLHASESYFDPSIGSGGTWDAYDCGKPNLGLFSMNRLEAYTIDLELTRRFCLHDCWMQGSVGLRHAEIEHAESLTGTALASDANLFGYAEAERYTRGTGIVLGWYGRKPIFPCSCVHWYYNLRWSAVWGPTQTAVETGATVLATNGNAGSVNGAATCVDDNLFIGEVQLGLEWNYALKCLPANAFFRTGLEYQRWTGGIGYSESSSFAGIEVNDEFTTVGSTFASAAAPELDLIGLTLGTGLTW